MWPKKEIILLGIGTVVTFVTVLISSYFGSFVTREAHARDMSKIDIIVNDIQHIKEDISEIKEKISE